MQFGKIWGSISSLLVGHHETFSSRSLFVEISVFRRNARCSFHRPPLCRTFARVLRNVIELIEIIGARYLCRRLSRTVGGGTITQSEIRTNMYRPLRLISRAGR